MKPEIIAILGIFLAFIIAEIIFTNFFKKKNQTTSDGIVEFLSTGLLLFITQPAIIIAVSVLGPKFFPQLEGQLSGLNVFAAFGLFLIFDDLTQYWWHRLSHTLPWLYKLHRPHHNAEYMSIRLVYRNNAFYYMMMPGLWFSAILVYLGLGWVYAFYIVMKMTIIFGAHSDLACTKSNGSHPLCGLSSAPLVRLLHITPIMAVTKRMVLPIIRVILEICCSSGTFFSVQLRLRGNILLNLVWRTCPKPRHWNNLSGLSYANIHSLKTVH